MRQLVLMDPLAVVKKKSTGEIHYAEWWAWSELGKDLEHVIYWRGEFLPRAEFEDMRLDMMTGQFVHNDRW